MKVEYGYQGIRIRNDSAEIGYILGNQVPVWQCTFFITYKGSNFMLPFQRNIIRQFNTLLPRAGKNPVVGFVFKSRQIWIVTPWLILNFKYHIIEWVKLFHHFTNV